MDEERIEYRGARVLASLPQTIAPQLETHYLTRGSRRTTSLVGHPMERVRYGAEPDDWGADDHSYGDCAVIKGEYHVIGCDVECWLNCGGQVVTCDYDDDDDEGDDEDDDEPLG